MKKTSFIEEDQRFIQKTSPFHSSKNAPESDREMLTRVAIKFAVVFVVIVLFDSIVDWVLGLFDLLFELIHLAMDAVEYSVELILETTFETRHYQSEIIIMNGVLLIALYVLYRVVFAFPRMFIRFKRNYKAASLLRKRRRSARWEAMSLSSKSKLISAYVFGISCLLFLVTL